MGPVTFRFAGLTLDLTSGRLHGANGDVTLRPKSFALLCYMVRHAGRVLSKDELLTAIWPDVTVTEDSLSQCIHDLRQGLGQPAASFQKTIPRRGYLFELPMTDAPPAFPRPVTPDPSAPDATRPPDAPVLRRDGIAVMPFATLSGTVSDTRFLDGLVHDITSHLARLRSFHVIARGSTFALRHLAADPQAAGRLLGVSYVFSGMAQVIGDAIRLKVDLVDAADGKTVWTGEIEGQRSAHGPLLAEMADRLAQTISREITVSERNRSLLVTDQPLDAWQSYHRGLFHMLQFTSDEAVKARAFFERAVALDAAFARAHAGASYCYFLEAFMRPKDQRQTEIGLALQWANRAVELDERNPSSHWAYGRALWLAGDEDGALDHLRSAVTLSPSFAMGYQTLAFMLSQSGDPETAIRHAEKATSLSPHDPFLCALYGSHAMALLRMGEVEKAAALGLKAARQHNVHKHILGITAIALALAGRQNEALEQLARIRRLDPTYAMRDFMGAFMRLSDDARAIFGKAGPLLQLE